MKEVKILAIDLAKNIFHLYGVDDKGHEVLRKRTSRQGLKEILVKMDTCLVAMEACGGAHEWARFCLSVGHDVHMIAPQYVKPHVPRQKNDMNDAKGIAKAAMQVDTPKVAIKTKAQQELMLIHRVRERLVANRVALGQEIRGLLMEFGIVFPQGRKSLLANLNEYLARDDTSGLMQQTFCDLQKEYLEIEKKVAACETRIDAMTKDNPVRKNLETIPGVGILTSTAVIGSIGDPKQFKNGRHLSAYLGLVPRQNSTGGKTKLGGITKQGNPYLRKLLIHGARSCLIFADKKNDGVSRWVTAVKERRGIQKATVALANKNARIIWAVMARNEVYKPRAMAA